ncbi:glycoside hydrolase family 43 protein [Kribbella sp. NBC_00889]|uniref:glycoside hydrolase family 43 protein n=1 Tax=Kribbella sp. NBC_00889 TaxID=2975974 RepID=UPI003865B05F|nr:glycoside hydrolase family 43 protein [Kribbella sp. NBC_00889]
MTSSDRPEYVGYLYAHFKRESADGEQIYFAVSDGNDPLHFRELNDGTPVLCSTLGERGVRDPHLVRSPEGQDGYLVHWSSTLYDNPEHEGASYNRIMCATTRDFREFSEPRVWIDRGWQTIDATVIDHEGVYYRILKDERSRSGDAPLGKSIFSETSTSLTAADWKSLAEGIGLGTIVQGEGPLVYKSNTEEKWYLWIDEFTPQRRYVPFETTDLAGGRWIPSQDYRLPTDPCHGVVLPVTAEECDRLRTAWT